MYPLVLVALFASLVTYWMAGVHPDDMQRITDTHATAHAGNFWAYRQGLVAYQNKHFQAANGYIDYGNLSGGQPSGTPVNAKTGFLPPGFVMLQSATNTSCTHNSNARDLWSHWFAGGRLYTFSCLPVEALPGGMVTTLANDHGRSLMIGIRRGDRIKTLHELNIPPYSATGSFFADFPPQIPDGAFVAIGN